MGHKANAEAARRAGWHVIRYPTRYIIIHNGRRVSKSSYRYRETAELAMIGMFERTKFRKNPLNEADYVMGGVVLLAVFGTVYYFATRPSVAASTSAQIPATSDAEPPFVPGA
ncbi:MAG: hypothetical protein WCA31_05850 [Acidimicrobiales bacterium]